MNTVWDGDCLSILKGWPDGCVDLVYLDPPFNSGRDYGAFSDKWRWDDYSRKRIQDAHSALKGLHTILGDTHMMAYLLYMGERLEEMRRVLKDTGSIYLHCDPSSCHYLKVVMDGLFGLKGFRNEIVWKRTSSHNDASRYGRIHDVILYYVKGRKPTWNAQYTPYSDEYVRRVYKHVDAESNRKYGSFPLFSPDEDNGRRYKLDDLTNPQSRGRRYKHENIEAPGGRGPEYEVMGHVRHWRYAKKTMDKLIAKGLIIQTKPGTIPRLKLYLDERKGVPLQDIWTDISYRIGKTERAGFRTQKPVALLERIIKTSSKEGDVVLDPFCGSGTTLVAAKGLNRNYIGMDLSQEAVAIARNRLSSPASPQSGPTP